jgi:hypothetical protein
MFAIGSTLSVLAGCANAATIGFDFDATLSTGPLAGTSFSGTGSYDNQGQTGKGQEYFSLTSFDFTLLDSTFTKANIYQGGQAILNNGVLFTFTAALIPPPNSSISNIAFGFGGPHVIGYEMLGPNSFGSGSYTVAAAPEPAAFNIALLGLAGIAVGSFRLRKAKRSLLHHL